MVNSYTEVEAQGGSKLPQLDASTYEEQLAWLFLTFVAFYFIVSRFALPKISGVLETREEMIANDLDMADIKKREAEDVKASYEATLEEARSQAHTNALQAKEASSAEFAKVKADLDAKLGAEAAKAEANIAKAVSTAMTEIDQVVVDVASELVKKVSGGDADGKKLSSAVKSALTTAKEA